MVVKYRDHCISLYHALVAADIKIPKQWNVGLYIDLMLFVGKILDCFHQ